MKCLALLLPLFLGSCTQFGPVDSTTWTVGGSIVPPIVYASLTVHHWINPTTPVTTPLVNLSLGLPPAPPAKGVP